MILSIIPKNKEITVIKKAVALMCLTAVIIAGCGKTEQGSFADRSSETAFSIESDTSYSSEERTKVYPDIYKSEIRRAFDKTASENNGAVYIEYACQDIDSNSVPELLLEYGTCDEDIKTFIYTCDTGGKLQLLGEVEKRTFFAYDKDNGELVLLNNKDNKVYAGRYKVKDGLLNEYESSELPLDEEGNYYDSLKKMNVIQLASVHAYNDGGTKSYIIDPESGLFEGKDGLYLDNIG